MDNIIKLNQIVTGRDSFLNSTPQTCYLNDYTNLLRECGAGCCVICNFADNRRFLCKLFIKSTIYADCSTSVDESVEIISDYDQLSLRGSADPVLNGIEVIKQNFASFSTISVEIFVNPGKLNLNLVKNMKSIEEILRNLLIFMFFSEKCLISLDCYSEKSCGITNVYVKSTGSSDFGKIDENTSIKIEKIHFQSVGTTQKRKLGGLEKPSEEIRKLIEAYKTLKKKSSSHALIVGPSGVGKYSLIKNLISEGCALFEIRGLDFIKPHPGETEEELRKIFKNIYKFIEIFGNRTVTVLLVKDVECLCPNLDKQKGRDNANISRISSQFTALLDANSQLKESSLIVIATTSNIESLDFKLRRPGRLEKEIHIRIPSEKQRKDILSILLREDYPDHLKDSITDYVSIRTPGYVGADLELLIQFVRRQRMIRSEEKVLNMFDDALKNVRPSALRGDVGVVTDLSNNLDSLGGMDSLKKSLRVSVLGPLQHPESFKRFGMKPLKGILLYGPPGCAKTTIAKCLAAETKMTFLSVSAAEVYSPYVGNAEKLISRLFNQARMSAPAVIFLDEIDSLVGSRSMQGLKANDVHTRVLSTLLTEMDGVGMTEQSAISTNEDAKNILVIAATNRPDMIDDALLRPGRLTKLIHVPAPDFESRHQIFNKLAAKMPFSDDVDFEQLAHQTERYSGADIINLCNQAALYAATLDMDVEHIHHRDLVDVLKDNRPSLTSDQIIWYEQFENKHKFV